MNCWNIRPIPQIWLLLTSVSYQNSNSSSLVNVFFFFSNQEAISAVEKYFADLTKNHYRDGIMALEHRWNKCISHKGDYVEK
jgi:hypothetical protein